MKKGCRKPWNLTEKKFTRKVFEKIFFGSVISFIVGCGSNLNLFHNGFHPQPKTVFIIGFNLNRFFIVGFVQPFFHHGVVWTVFFIVAFRSVSTEPIIKNVVWVDKPVIQPIDYLEIGNSDSTFDSAKREMDARLQHSENDRSRATRVVLLQTKVWDNKNWSTFGPL